MSGMIEYVREQPASSLERGKRAMELTQLSLACANRADLFVRCSFAAG